MDTSVVRTVTIHLDLELEELRHIVQLVRAGEAENPIRGCDCSNQLEAVLAKAERN